MPNKPITRSAQKLLDEQSLTDQVGNAAFDPLKSRDKIPRSPVVTGPKTSSSTSKVESASLEYSSSSSTETLVDTNEHKQEISLKELSDCFNSSSQPNHLTPPPTPQPNDDQNNVPNQPLVNREPPAAVIMAGNQTVALKDALRVVPEFEGGNAPLTPFLEGCDEALAMVGDAAELNLTKMLRSKLVGEARQAISGKAFATLRELKTFLKTIYFANKSLYQLQGDLGSIYQREDESVISFANRVKEIGKKLVETNLYQNNPDAAGAATFRTQTETHMVECFKRGLRPEIEQRMTNADNIDDIVTNAIRAERDIMAQMELRKMSHSNSQVDLKSQRSSRHVRANTYEDTFDSDLEINAHPDDSSFFRINKTQAARCQICNSVGHIAYNCENYRCSRCGHAGHRSNVCPHPETATASNIGQRCQLCLNHSHTAEFCPIITCYHCGERGHISRECPRLRESSKTRCQLCLLYGHSAAQCQEAVRNSGMMGVTTTTCQLCDQPGHLADKCPSSPLIKNQVICQVCRKHGHSAKSCFKMNPPNRNGNPKTEAGAQLACQLCQKVGHTAATCRNRSSSNDKLNKSCAYCKAVGHTINECIKRQRRNQGTNQGNEKDPSASNEQKESIAIRSINQFTPEDLMRSATLSLPNRLN